MIEAWFDGACEDRNPGGHGSYGALVKVNGEIVFADGAYVGFGPTISNNVSEYSGAIAVLEHILTLSDLAGADVIIRGDSKMVIMQLSRKWKARACNEQGKPMLYFPFYRRACELRDRLELTIVNRVRFEWIPRELNGECDELSKRVLRDRGIVFRLQPEGH